MNNVIFETGSGLNSIKQNEPNEDATVKESNSDNSNPKNSVRFLKLAYYS